MLVLIKLTSAGVNAGPFNLFSNVDGYVTPFATGISRTVLLTGYLTNSVPDGSTVVRCVSTGTCTNYVDFNITTGLTTTTTTTTIAPTTTSTTTSSGTTSTTTSTTTNTPFLGKILVTDRPNPPLPSEPVECYGTMPPTSGTAYYRQTVLTLLDQFNNPITVGYNITASINYIFDPCGSPVPSNIPINFTILANNISSNGHTYTSSTLVDCGQSDCGPESTTFDAPISNSVGAPFTLNIIP
jgi:hypothetical protein